MYLISMHAYKTPNNALLIVQKYVDIEQESFIKYLFIYIYTYETYLQKCYPKQIL